MKPHVLTSLTFRLLAMVLTLAAAQTQTSCVHEFPENTMP